MHLRSIHLCLINKSQHLLLIFGERINIPCLNAVTLKAVGLSTMYTIIILKINNNLVENSLIYIRKTE